MVATICSNERRNWNRLVQDDLPANEAHELTKHLEVCVSCREKFESLCADASWWKGTSSTLRLIETESGIFNTKNGASGEFSFAQSEESSSTNRTKTSPLVVISGLKPSQEPGALGDLDDYTIREVIGYGGMGTVLKAWDKRLSRVVAIKVLHPHLATSGAARVRFAKEAQAVASISHPNVVPIHDVADDYLQPYIVMGFVSGGSLQDKLDRDGPLTLEESLRIGLQIAEGLEAAHSHGLVHRDIKPANILLEARWQRVLITDFGLARALDDASITASGHLAGTPQYMSPEQSRGDKIDHRSDLYSLGSVLYAMLAGRPPFRAENAVAIIQKVGREPAKPVHEIQNHLPFWAHQLIERLHAKNPRDRVPTAVETSNLLRCCLQHVQNPSSGTLPRGFQATKSRWVRKIAQLVAVILAVGLLAISAANLGMPTSSSKLPSPPSIQSTATASAGSQGAESAAPQGSVPIPLGHGLFEQDVTDWNGSIDHELDWMLFELSRDGFELSK